MRRSVAVVAAGLLFTACVSKSELIRRVDQLAGAEAVDCGYVRPQEDPAPSADCARAALASRKPFKVIIERRGTDSAITSGIVRTPDGKLIEVVHDSDRWGGSRLIPGPLMRESSCSEITFGAGRQAIRCQGSG